MFVNDCFECYFLGWCELDINAGVFAGAAASDRFCFGSFLIDINVFDRVLTKQDSLFHRNLRVTFSLASARPLCKKCERLIPRAFCVQRAGVLCDRTLGCFIYLKL